METPTVCACRCIPEAEGAVPLPLTLFTIHYTDGNTDDLCPSVYSRGKGNYSLPLALFTINNTEGNTVQTTDGNNNGSCPSVYSRCEGNCSPSYGGDGN